MSIKIFLLEFISYQNSVLLFYTPVCYISRQSHSITPNINNFIKFHQYDGTRDESDGLGSLDLLEPWLQVLLITSKYSAIADLHTHTAPLLVAQLKHRNYNSLTELHIPSITHE
jgi:hypothetical protein